MLEIKKSIEQGFSGKPGGLYDILKQLQNVGLGVQGEVYFVENNAGSDSNDGSCWDKAFKTLTYALAISHANIAAGNKGWASRNTIFIKGDPITEDLTKFAQKTNVVGVGSTADVPYTTIIGTHALEAQATADYMGCHFYNIQFQDDGASVNITIPADQNGIEFHNCLFTMASGCLTAIKATSVYRLKIEDCKFRPDAIGNKFANCAIWILGTTVGGIEINRNDIYGTIGIDCDSTNAVDCQVKDNLIVAATFVIDDESQDLIVSGNNMITATANDITPQEVCHVNVKLAVNNVLTGDTKTTAMPVIATS